MNQYKCRTQLLFEHGATVPVAQELLAYNANQFSGNGLVASGGSLLPEPHLVAWEGYLAEASCIGAFAALQKRLIQLNYPVKSGISESAGYQTAVSQGNLNEQHNQPELTLRAPQKVTLTIHPTLAGPIPVIQAANHHDFTRLVQALVHKNEPVPIPTTMSACIVSGYNNWDRIHAWRQEWEAALNYDAADYEWAVEFQRHVKPFRHLYQDTFILLSTGDYSDVPAHEMGLSNEKWSHYSHLIRLAHESSHYVTHRLFGSMRNNLLDELIADYWGIRHAIGQYRADWFLQFMGLADGTTAGENGRLHQYRGNPPLSDAAFVILQTVLRDAACNLETADQLLKPLLKTAVGQRQMFTTLTQFTLEELTHRDAPTWICKAVTVANNSSNYSPFTVD